MKNCDKAAQDPITKDNKKDLSKKGMIATGHGIQFIKHKLFVPTYFWHVALSIIATQKSKAPKFLIDTAEKL